MPKLRSALNRYYDLSRPSYGSLDQAIDEIMLLRLENELLELENARLKYKPGRGRPRKIKFLEKISSFSDIFTALEPNKSGRPRIHDIENMKKTILQFEEIKDCIEEETGTRPNDKKLISMIADIRFRSSLGWKTDSFALKHSKKLKDYRDATGMRQRDFKKRKTSPKNS